MGNKVQCPKCLKEKIIYHERQYFYCCHKRHYVKDCLSVPDVVEPKALAVDKDKGEIEIKEKSKVLVIEKPKTEDIVESNDMVLTATPIQDHEFNYQCPYCENKFDEPEIEINEINMAIWKCPKCKEVVVRR